MTKAAPLPSPAGGSLEEIALPDFDLSDLPELPAAPAAAPVEPSPAAAAQPAPGRWAGRIQLGALALAGLASFLAVIGLFVAGRTAARATAAIEESAVATRELLALRTSLAHAGGAAAPSHAPAATAGTAASIDDVDRAMDRLRQDIVKYTPPGGNGPAMYAVIRSGQGELVDRISQLSAQLDRLERQLSASRPVSHAAGRARPS